MKPTISIEEVVDYTICPLLYLYRYRRGTDIYLINLSEKFHMDVNKVVSLYFNTIRNGERAGLSNMKNAWGSIWMQNKTGKQIVLEGNGTWRKNLAPKRREGMNILTRFVDNFKGEVGVPIAVDYPYSVDVDGVELTGKWPLIREIRKDYLSDERSIQIMDFRIERHKVMNLHYKNDLTMTAASYAFRETFKETEDDVVFYNLSKGIFTNSTRSKSDYGLLRHTVNTVYENIKDERFYATVTDRCYNCPYRKECSVNINERFKEE